MSRRDLRELRVSRSSGQRASYACKQPLVGWHLLLLFPLLQMIGGTCMADVTVIGLTGDKYSFGTPVAGSFSNFIEFVPGGSITFAGDEAYFIESPVAELGIFMFANGKTVGTGSTVIANLSSTGIAINDFFQPNLITPVKAWFSIPVAITPNVTGDPWGDADYWGFPNIGVVTVPEEGSGWVKAYGKLVGVQVASPPAYYRVQLTGLEYGGGDVGFAPSPIPVPGAFALVIIGALSLRHLVREGPRRSTTPDR